MWTCSSCRTIVEGERCFQCGATRPGSGGAPVASGDPPPDASNRSGLRVVLAVLVALGATVRLVSSCSRLADSGSSSSSHSFQPADLDPDRAPGGTLGDPLLSAAPAEVIADTRGSASPNTPQFSERLQRQLSMLTAVRCEKGEAEACTLLGSRYAAGEGLRPDDAKALRYWGRGCKGGDRAGCFLQARADADPAAAAAQYRTLCDEGMLPACGALGYLMLEGQGVKKDAGKGVGLLDKACSGGDGESCFHLGVRVMSTKGQRRDKLTDDARAFRAFKAGCEAEDPDACNNLALMYGLGQGTRRDQDAAARAFARSCELGSDSEVCGKLRRETSAEEASPEAESSDSL